MSTAAFSVDVSLTGLRSQVQVKAFLTADSFTVGEAQLLLRRIVKIIVIEADQVKNVA